MWLITLKTHLIFYFLALDPTLSFHIMTYVKQTLSDATWNHEITLCPLFDNTVPKLVLFEKQNTKLIQHFRGERPSGSWRGLRIG